MKKMLICCITAIVSLTVYGVDEEFVTIESCSFYVKDSVSSIPVKIHIDAFEIAKTETTQQQFKSVMGYNNSVYKGNTRPVENVSWYEAVEYCNKKSQVQGLKCCYDLKTGKCDFNAGGYYLPTERQWELANKAEKLPSVENMREYSNVGDVDTKSVDNLLELTKKGTYAVASLKPNINGIYDMTGNVWEWCYDYFSSIKDHPLSVDNPNGPAKGIDRVIRGGSFVSSLTPWSFGNNYRSSMSPENKSRFTGFRICRKVAGKADSDSKRDEHWYTKFNTEAKAAEMPASLLVNEKGDIINTLHQWQKKRSELKKKWDGIVSVPAVGKLGLKTKVVTTYHEQGYTGEMIKLQVAPDSWEKILVMTPDKPIAEPTPVVIVPFYDVDSSAGKNLGGRLYNSPGVRSYARLFVQQGYVAVAVKWFGESYGENYEEAVANLHLKYRNCTGLGKWVWDSQRVLDYIYSLDGTDHDKIAIVGHSLGAKMALYAAAMDDRIKAVVFSEGGISLDFSNYDDYWYLGPKAKSLPTATDQHELLALIAPRPFMLVAGNKYDTDSSYAFVKSAREVYKLYGKGNWIAFYNHKTGHSPTAESVSLMIDWVNRFFLDDK